jgi:hypothetical protein
LKNPQTSGTPRSTFGNVFVGEEHPTKDRFLASVLNNMALKLVLKNPQTSGTSLYKSNLAGSNELFGESCPLDEFSYKPARIILTHSAYIFPEG